VSPHSSFRDLIRQVRAGNEEAMTELVRRYEPTVRLVVRVRLTDPALRRVFDSMDICQSVMKDFFLRVSQGEFELDSPEHLLRLLTTMARNKVINQALHEQAARRDVRRVEHGALDEGDLVDPGLGPSDLAADHELFQNVCSRLSPEERFLAEQWALGRSWAEIAAEVGESADTLRMRLRRALDRVAAELTEQP